MKFYFGIASFFLLLLPAKLWGIIEITGIIHNSAPDIPSCVNGNGSIDLTAQGNAGPFTYSWSNGQTTEDINGLCPNTYTVTVTNAFGCTKVLVANIYNCHQYIKTPEVTNSNIIPVSIPGASNGSIEITATGGWNLIYKWTKQGNSQVIATTEDIYNLPGGTYCVELSGACSAPVLRCFTVLDCSINGQPAPTLSFNAIGDNTFNKPSKPGSIDLIVQGGNPPFTYLWDNGATGQDITEGTFGTYKVTVTDYCNNTVSGEAVITLCHGYKFLPLDNCTNDPELLFAPGIYLEFNSNEFIDDILPIATGLPMFCDRVIHIDWPDGNHSTLNLDLGTLVNPSEPLTDNFAYNPIGIWDVPSSLYGYLCTVVTDNCGCSDQACGYIADDDEMAGGWDWNIAGDLGMPPLSGQNFYVISSCFECKMCTTPGSVPGMNYMSQDACHSNYSSTTLQYINNDPENPCTGGQIRCPKLNTYYEVIEGFHGDLIVDWTAVPIYDVQTGDCIYPLGCLFPEGTVQGIDGPVYVENTNGYHVENIGELCEPPPPPQECNGIEIQDPNGMDENCEVKIFCLPNDGGPRFVVRIDKSNKIGCECNGVIIEFCRGGEPECPGGNVIYDGDMPYPNNSGGLIIPEEFTNFITSYYLEVYGYIPHGIENKIFKKCSELRPAINEELNSRSVQIEILNFQELEVSPNPTKGKINLHSIGEEFKAIYLYNIAGSLIKKWDIESELNSTIELDLPNNLIEGAYFLRVILENGDSKYSKLVKIE